MAKIKCEIKEDSTLVKFEAVQIGEIFVCDGHPFIKICPHERFWADAISLEDGKFDCIAVDTLVTYVKKAELKLTI